MPKPSPKAVLAAASRYLKAHPEELVRAARGAAAFRIGVPLDALRYLVRELGQGKKAPRDVVIEAAPPGVRLGATFRVMGSTLRGRLNLYLESVDASADKALVSVRIADMELEVIEGTDSPVAALIKSGSLDLSKPGNLMAFLPNRPPMVVDAKDDQVVLDLLKAPKLADNGRMRRILRVIAPVLAIDSIRTRDDHLDVQLRASPSRLSESWAAARA